MIGRSPTAAEDSRRAFIPAFSDIGLGSASIWINFAANRAGRLIQIKRLGCEHC
jgi:hypothetical protein